MRLCWVRSGGEGSGGERRHWPVCGTLQSGGFEELIPISICTSMVGNFKGRGRIEMDKNRRDFFRNLVSKSAVLAAGAVAPAIVYMDTFKIEIDALSRELNQKLAKSTDDLKAQIRSLNNRLDSAALTMTYQQAQICFIFLLLLISFAIDAGITAAWVLA